MSRGSITAAIVIAALAGTATAVLLMPDTAPTSRPARRVVVAQAELPAEPEAAALPAPRTAPRSRSAKKAAKTPPPETLRRVENQRELKAVEGNERAELRQEMREENLALAEERLHAFATQAGWDDDQTQLIMSLIASSHAEVNAVLERVDLGEMGWDEARPMMRAVRDHHSSKVRDTLGPEAYAAFAEQMSFSGSEIRPPAGSSKKRRARAKRPAGGG